MPAAPTFRDLANQTRWLTILLYAHAVFCVIWIASDWMQLVLLASAPYSAADAEANDTRQAIVGTLYLLSLTSCVIAVAIWVYRANANAHALGARDMQFTPGWAVGWYFIPIATYWKPYQAMTEIWKASRNPAAWQSEVRTSTLPRWWLFWVAAIILGQVSFRMSSSARTLDQLTTSTWVNIFASVVTIPSAVLLAQLAREIWSMQMAHAVAHESEAPLLGTHSSGMS